jgi:hypothetical protein
MSGSGPASDARADDRRIALLVIAIVATGEQLTHQSARSAAIAAP